MPKINLSLQYANADDTPAINADDKTPVTLKQMLIQACLSDSQNGDNSKKVKKYSLYRDLKRAKKELNLSSEDIVLLKEAIMNWPTLVVGQTHEMLEGQYHEPWTDSAPSIGGFLDDVQA